MKILSNNFAFLVAMLCSSLFLSCSTTVEAPPPPAPASASDSSSSSLPAATAGKVLCLLSGQCLYIPATDCSVIGGQEVQKCELASSSSPATTTSSGSVVQLPSSNSIEQTISSSSSAMLPVSSSSLVSNVVLCLFNGSCVSIDSETCSSIGGLQVLGCFVSSGSNQPSSSSVQQLQSSSSVVASSSSTTISVSSTRCKDSQNRDLYCSWTSGCYAIDPAFAETLGRTCEYLVEECRMSGSLFAGVSLEGAGIKCAEFDGPLPSSSSPAVVVGVFADSRNAKVYKKVTIGTQTWMAENLNHYVEGSLCYDNLESNCAKYGRLYSWESAIRDICPPGWHLPSETEWGTLLNFLNPDCDLLGNCDRVGRLLKATSGWSESGNGTDDYGFSALPGGDAAPDYSSNINFHQVGKIGWWWSTMDTDARDTRNVYTMYYLSSNVQRETSDKTSFCSVRCVQN